MRASYDVGFGMGTWLRLLFYAWVWGCGPTALGVLMLGTDLIAAINGPRFDPRTYVELPETIPLDVQHALIPIPLVAIPLVGTVLAVACLRMRAPRRVRVELDAWGVTELEGDDVRTAIAWAGSKLHALEVRVLSRGRRIGTHHLLSIADAHGFAICVRDLVRGATWMRRRPTQSYRMMTLDVLGAKPNSSVVSIDPRDARRGLATFSTLADLGIAASLAATANGAFRWQEQEMALAMFVAAMLGGLRALRPLVELVRLRSEGAATRDAKPVRLTGLAGERRASFVDASGQSGVLELDGVAHPDGRLAERTTSAFVVLEGASDGGPYRGAPARAKAIETNRDRRERRRLTLACAIELVLRGAQIAVFALISLAFAMSWQEH